jgi:hypothetical protein
LMFHYQNLILYARSLAFPTVSETSHDLKFP